MSHSKDKEQECALCYQSGSVGYVRFKFVTMVDSEGCYCLRCFAM